eukprot:4692464-Amphidinium_carterae.1
MPEGAKDHGTKKTIGSGYSHSFVVSCNSQQQFCSQKAFIKNLNGPPKKVKLYESLENKQTFFLNSARFGKKRFGLQTLSALLLLHSAGFGSDLPSGSCGGSFF